MTTQSALITVMTRAARRAARGLLRDFGEVEQLQVSRKGPADFVSQADLKAERTLREELERARPEFGFLMEESGAAKAGDGRHRWIVDPLDGTTNFLHGVPHFAISIAAERDGELIAGVVYEPLRDETFWAEKGQGAYLNQRRLRVSARQQLRDALIGTGIPFMGRGNSAESRRYLAELGAVMGAVAGIRRWGTASLDLAFVAAGRFDGFWEHGLGPWDVAAGIVLVREAGGFVSEVEGGSSMLASGSILAANDHLHGILGDVLRKAGKA
ncbi:MAG: inositol monophosphatase [Alphaproteobacteria bacterium]|nr:inositol monophosphatase [Alphaproteobacteria bacterium]